MSRVPHFRSVTMIWFLLLLAYFFTSDAQETGNTGGGSGGALSQTIYRYPSRSSYQPKKSPFSDPGVIVGIIVGVLGVLVVLGVTILLCKLFCCKHTSCCGCCRRGETYREASTVPIKIPSDESRPGHEPISIISQDRRLQASKNTKSRQASAPEPKNPPEYDDVPQFNWKINDLTKNRPAWDPDLERRSQEALAAPSDEEVKEALASGGDLKRKKKKKKKATPAVSTKHTLDTRLPGKDKPDSVQEEGEEGFNPIKFQLSDYSSEPASQDHRARTRGENPVSALDEIEVTPSETGRRNYDFEPVFPKSRARARMEKQAATPDEDFQSRRLKHGVRSNENDETSILREKSEQAASYEGSGVISTDHGSRKYATNMPSETNRIRQQTQTGERPHHMRISNMPEHGSRENSFEDDKTRRWVRETPEATFDNKNPTPSESTYRIQSSHQSHQDERARKWEKGRISRQRNAASASMIRGSTPSGVQMSSGIVNQGFNEGSTETTV